MIRKVSLTIALLLVTCFAFAQHTTEQLKQLNFYQDSLKNLGNTLINNPNDLERKNANYDMIRTLVSALKVNNSFLFKFDSVKAITILNSPDNRFRIFTWHLTHDDGSYRFYGAIQMNTGGALKLYPLEDYSPLQTNPEDSVTDNHKWYGAQYYSIVPVNASTPYYVLLGWKGNTVKSTKKVIDVISFKNNVPQFGMPVFYNKTKRKSRVVFEYARQASMLLRYVADQNLIVFDNLVPPDDKMKNQPEMFGPDLSYNAYRLQNGRWEYVDNIDMRNVPNEKDIDYIDPKTTIKPVIAVPKVNKKTVQ